MRITTTAGLLLALCQAVIAIHREMSSLERHHVFGTRDEEKVPEYWLDRPRKSELDDILYNVTYMGREETFRIRLHKRLFGDEFHMISRDTNSSSFSLSMSEQDCVYQGESLSDPDTVIALVGCGEKMHGMIITSDGEHFLIQPHSKSDRHIIHKRSAALSHDQHSCLFDVNEDPYPEDRRDVRVDSMGHGGHRMAIVKRHHPLEDIRRAPTRREAVTNEIDLTIELAVFADDAMWRHFVELYGNRADAEMHRFILAAVNNIDILYGQRAINPRVNIKIVRYEVLKNPPASMTKQNHLYGDVDRLLDAFCEYQSELNPQGDSDPKHWDHALLFSGYDLYRDGLKTVAGYAPVKGMCSESRSCTINEGLDFGSVFVVTHEMGHSLGMYHDGDNECDLRCCIMSPSVGTGKTQWSQCSVKEFHVFVGKLGAPARPQNCLRDLPFPQESMVFKDRESPGQQFTVGEQCAVFHGECWKHELRDGQQLAEVCEMVWCGNGEGIIRTAHPALEGTNCGPNMWCRNGQCVPAPGVLDPIHGSWGTWNEQPGACRSKCSDCEIQGQVRLRRSTRLCNRPAPNNGGRECQGDDARGIVCDSKPCSGVKLDEYASVVCGKMKNDPDNPNPQLSGIGLQFEQAPCKVWCQMEMSNNIRTVSNFPDGTPCGEGSYCIKGECRPLLCNGFAVAETETECPYGPRFRAKTTMRTTVSASTTHVTTMMPPSPRPTVTQGRRVSSLQRLMSTPQIIRGAPIGRVQQLQAAARARAIAAQRNNKRTVVPNTAARVQRLPQPSSQYPPVWTQWSEFSDCLTVQCGERGVKVRIRRCVGDRGEYVRDELCNGRKRETVACMGPSCNALSTRRLVREMPVTPSITKGAETPVGMAKSFTYAAIPSHSTSPQTIPPPPTSTLPSTTATQQKTIQEHSIMTSTLSSPPPTTVTTPQDDETFMVEIQDEPPVETSVVEKEPIPMNPNLVLLLPKSHTTTTMATTTSEHEEEEEEEGGLEPMSKSLLPIDDSASDIVESRDVEDNDRVEKMEKPARAFSGYKSFDEYDDVINVPEPKKRAVDVNNNERFGMRPRTSSSLDDDGVINVAEPRSHRGNRALPSQDDTFSVSPKQFPELVKIPEPDLSGDGIGRIRMPVRQFVSDPSSPDGIRERRVEVEEEIPNYDEIPRGGSMGFIPQEQYIPEDKSGGGLQLLRQPPPESSNLLAKLATLFGPMGRGLNLPLPKPPQHPDQLPPHPGQQSAQYPAWYIAQQRQRLQLLQQLQRYHAEALSVPQRASLYQNNGRAAGYINVYPGPPPSSNPFSHSIDSQAIMKKKEEEVQIPRSPFDDEKTSMEEKESTTLATVTVVKVNDESIDVPSPKFDQKNETVEAVEVSTERTAIVMTSTTGRPLPVIYGDEEGLRKEKDREHQQREAKAIRETDNIRNDIIIINSPVAAGFGQRISPQNVPLYQKPTVAKPIYVLTGGATEYGGKRVRVPGSYVANGASYTTAAYASPRQRISPSYTTPRHNNPVYSTTPYTSIHYTSSTPYYYIPSTTYPTPPPPEWGSWSPCSITCGNGIRTRKLDYCHDEIAPYILTSTPTSSTSRVSVVEGLHSSTPSFVVEPFCVQKEICVLDPCWRHSEWSDWTGCSKECGTGFALRRRVCELGECPGPFSESRRCEATNCEKPSIWGEWGDWSECAASCGIGTRLRTRECHSERCLGTNREARRCQTSISCYDLPTPRPDDPPDSGIKTPINHPLIDPVTAPPLPPIRNIEDEWLSWAECSATCGLGAQIRRHRSSNRVQHRSCFIVSCNDFLP